MVQHTEPAVDSEVAEAYDVWTLHGEGHQHLSCPYTDPVQGGKLPAHLFVHFMLQRLNIQMPTQYFIGGVFDVSRLPERNTEALKLLDR